MATIQSKTSRGHKYWYIVESKRVNGKPRPIVLAYLGKADGLLRRLKGLTDGIRLKSYSHGAVAALLKIASELDIPVIINKYIDSKRHYRPKKPLSNSLTAGITLLLAAIGRVCMPTSKRGWQSWAKTTTLQYLLRCSLSKIDSQHFWDLMDALPVGKIPRVEADILANVFKTYGIESDSLFFDTTNFFTYIDSTNTRSTIARRGRNKQKRHDLRQIGLAMVVTKADMIPLFHLTYNGNIADTVVFRKVIGNVGLRMKKLGLDQDRHTIIFDRGNNSKQNLAIIEKLGLFYVGALTPYHHKKLIADAKDSFKEINISGSLLKFYRDRQKIWGQERTVVIFISSKLKAGRIRGIYQSLKKIEKNLEELKISLASPRAKKRDRGSLEERVASIVKGQYVKNIINWSLEEVSDGRFVLKFAVDYKLLKKIEDDLGFRIIMTNRHSWSTASIIKAYHGQSKIENAFKNLKNPYHLTIKPQFHWTDHNVEVHMFICVLGYLLAAIAWRKARLSLKFSGTLDTLLDTLNNIRLATVLEDSKTPGAVKAMYKLEEMSADENILMEALEIKDLHNNRPRFNGVGVYN
jgi:transposase